MLMKPTHGVKNCRYELKTCCLHRKDGGTFRCADPDKRRESIWRAQGIKITYEQYAQILEDQGYKCKLCGLPQAEESRALSVDHCHATGKIRGVICRRCNSMLGWIENVTSLDELRTYLESSIEDKFGITG